MSDSPLIDQVQEIKDKKTYAMTGDETEQYKLIVDRLNSARTQRTMNRDEFDGMTYEQAYLTNQRAAFSYLAPKINNDDVRINTGTTEKKVEFVLNELLAMNLQNEILAYDKDDMPMQDVGDMLTDVVHRTEQMELADDKDLFILAELLSQPSVYVEENWVERKVRGRNGKWKTERCCERSLLNGTQIYLADMNLPWFMFNRQPYIFKYFRMTYNEGSSVFGDMDRWKYVHKGSYNTITPVPYQIYRKGSLLADEIEGWYYMSVQDGEEQLILQGVPMFPVGTPLHWDWPGYNIIMEGLKPFHADFAYGKSLAQAAKTLQALDNEMIRNLIRKFRQAIEPPTGVPSGKVYSRDIWSPGALTQGVTKDMFSKLIDHTGVTQSEMEMFRLVEEKVDEFTGRPQVTPEGSPTATQIVSEQREAAKMLGLSVLAAMRLKSKEGSIRAHNIVSNYTKATSKRMDPVTKEVREVFATFTLNETDLGDGKQGTKNIKFADRGLNDEELGDVFAEENRSDREGDSRRYSVVDAKLLRDLDLNFHAVAVPKPKDSRELEKVMIGDMYRQAGELVALTGRPLNADKATEKFERTWGAKDLFEKAPVVPPGAEMGMGPMGPAGPGAQPLNGVPGGPAKPAAPAAPAPVIPAPSVPAV